MDKNEKRPFGVIDGDMPLEMDADTKSLLVMKELFLGVKARVEGDEEEGARHLEKAAELKRQFGPSVTPAELGIVGDMDMSDESQRERMRQWAEKRLERMRRRFD